MMTTYNYRSTGMANFQNRGRSSSAAINVAALERSVEEIRNLHSRQLNGKYNLITDTYS